jgi:hypothetical protein
MALLSRLPSSDCIERFRRAVSQRFCEAESLAANGFPLASVYLHGYVVEMLLKAACFRIMGMNANAPIDSATFKRARSLGTSLGAGTPRNLHDILWWARFLVQLRAVDHRPFAAPFAGRLMGNANRVARNWRESLRYCTNRPRQSERTDVTSAALWFIEQYRFLY